MASGKYEAWSQLLLNALFNAAAYSFPTTLYLSFFTVAPTISSTGTEASGGSYARATVVCNTTNWPTISGSTTTISLGALVDFAQATGDWSSASNMVAAGIHDALSSGHLYYFGSLAQNKPVFNGDIAFFPIAGVTVQEL